MFEIDRQKQKIQLTLTLDREPTGPCFYCAGNHWNDMCLKYQTAEERKQRLKWRCYICLLSGHRAFECISTKQKCFYCKRKNQHHRSLCQLKFGTITNQCVNSTSTSNSKSNVCKNTKKQTHENKVSEQMEVEIIYPQSNIECEYYLARNDLHNTRLELAECKKETETLKEKISKLEREREGIQQSVRGYIEIIGQQTEELSQLKGKLESWERRKNDFSRSQRIGRTFDMETSDGIRADFEMSKFPKEVINRVDLNLNPKIVAGDQSKNCKMNTEALGIIDKMQNALLELQQIGKNKTEYSIPNTTKTLRDDEALSRNWRSHNDFMDTGEDGIDVLRKLFTRKVVIENCKPATPDIDSNNEQSVYALLEMLSLSTLKDAQ